MKPQPIRINHSSAQPISRKPLMNKPFYSRIHRTHHHHNHQDGSAPTGQAQPQDQPPISQLPHPTRPFYGKPMTEEFVKNFLGDKAVVDAYYHPKVIAEVASAGDPTHRSGLPTLIPMAAAMRAASQAAAMELIKPHERALVHLATIVYPCGLFLCARSQALSGREGAILNLEQVATMRGLLLARPSHHLRTQAPRLGDTLAAVLGLAVCDEDVSLAQVARISSAVYIANRKVSSIWGQS